MVASEALRHASAERVDPGDDGDFSLRVWFVDIFVASLGAFEEKATGAVRTMGHQGRRRGHAAARGRPDSHRLRAARDRLELNGPVGDRFRASLPNASSKSR